MRKHEGGFAPQDAAEWFENRSYKHEAFSDLSELGRLKRESGRTVSLVLPSRNVADTVGEIVDEVRALNERMPEGIPLVDQTLVVDADSEDGTADVARRKGAEVFSENELLSSYGGAHGKGDAMWRSLSVASGDVVMFADADTKDFKPQFVYGTLGPMFATPGVRFVKGLSGGRSRAASPSSRTAGARDGAHDQAPLQPLLPRADRVRAAPRRRVRRGQGALRLHPLPDRLRRGDGDHDRRPQEGRSRGDGAGGPRHPPEPPPAPLRPRPHELLRPPGRRQAPAPGRAPAAGPRPRAPRLPLPVQRVPPRRRDPRGPRAARARRGARRAPAAGRGYKRRVGWPHERRSRHGGPARGVRPRR
ncbi:glycosyltransferase [Rubrobacter marinus]|uniref:Glucosyl-3-phosphoglycerate synthase n=1 Tax=Rubrobacter marinus TaxID=2653852 RepID=A0A6G8Q2X0_9ACTN|nr:glycosyltransferase [Rubrobacter marinus]